MQDTTLGLVWLCGRGASCLNKETPGEHRDRGDETVKVEHYRSGYRVLKDGRELWLISFRERTRGYVEYRRCLKQ